MSIVYTLKKIVDPAAAREEEAQQKKAREEVRQQQSGDPPEAGAPGGEPTRWRCRCCGVEDDQGGYCPECLADTMEPLAARRAASLTAHAEDQS